MILLALGGCSFLLDESQSDDLDASVTLDASARDAAMENSTDFMRPYTCDEDTIALYHFDDGALAEDSCSDLDHVSGGNQVVNHEGFGQATVIAGQNAVHSTNETMEGITYSGELTLEGWVVPPAIPDTESYAWLVFSADDLYQTGTRRFAFGLTGNIGWTLRAELFEADCQNTAALEVAAPTIVSGQWHHIAVTIKDAGGDVTLTLYVDGAEIGGGIRSNGLCGTANSLIRVGGFPQSATPLFGHTIDEVRISSTIRTFTP